MHYFLLWKLSNMFHACVSNTLIPCIAPRSYHSPSNNYQFMAKFDSVFLHLLSSTFWIVSKSVLGHFKEACFFFYSVLAQINSIFDCYHGIYSLRALGVTQDTVTYVKWIHWGKDRELWNKQYRRLRKNPKNVTSRPVVSNLFGTRARFYRRQVFHGPG